MKAGVCLKRSRRHLSRRQIPLFLAFLTFFILPHFLFALEVPKRPEGYVTDKAKLLTQGTKAKLEAALAGFERQTTNQILVATFESLEGEALDDFSIRLAEAWRVGQKEKDNGVIFLIFKQDRKMRIEVGYGLEGVIPDAMAGQIIRQVVAPHFQAGQFEQGIVQGVGHILRATQGEFTAARTNMRSQYRRPLTAAEKEALARQGRVVGIAIMVAVLIFFIIDFTRYQKFKTDHRLQKEHFSFWEWWFRFALLLFVLNLLFRILFYSMLFSRGGYYGGRSGFGGFSGGGGGGFGGGGASGGW